MTYLRTDRKYFGNSKRCQHQRTDDRHDGSSTTSFTRKTPPTNPDTLVFLATFSEGVTGVEMNDFAVNGTTATISVSQLTASTYDVTVSVATWRASTAQSD